MHIFRVLGAILLALGGIACSFDVSGVAAEPDAGGPIVSGDDARPPQPDAPPGYTPEPVPDVGDVLPPPCPETTPTGYFQFLDDTCGARRQPGFVDRDRTCLVEYASTTAQRPDGTALPYADSSAPISVDTSALDGLVPADLYIAVILIRRVGGVPHYRYLSNGGHAAAIQPWSTSKFLAAANAAAYMRTASDYTVGLTAYVDGVPLGDLITSMHNYDNAHFTSNSLGRYFHDIGGRDRANDIIHEAWLGRGSAESFGGNYGDGAPDLSFHFEDGNFQLDVIPDTSSGPANRLSMLTLAEALKRLVLHREEPSQRLPGLQWLDVATLLHGAPASATYGPWGGMTADTAAYLHTGHDMDYIERRSRGRWMTYSKLGLGSSGQFLNVGYACMPVLDPNLRPVPDWGREFVIAAALPAGGGSWSERDRELAMIYRKLITRIVDGRLQ